MLPSTLTDKRRCTLSTAFVRWLLEGQRLHPELHSTETGNLSQAKLPHVKSKQNRKTKTTSEGVLDFTPLPPLTSLVRAKAV